MAKGWDICIADLTGKWYKITKDGKHNKEPDWVPVILQPGKFKSDTTGENKPEVSKVEND